eukprot:gnl/MRDRNA2_/MRDRNA2_87662_c0_seq1.p1 gnl/MRDRNA2_/MRDRNA2_87662_c0~~gnl/MRDRNA2_/MRDRNA2_87662_c0_seq1.p1  ORF type:complete len:346 (+),score=103.04 gnl/MRDRNA2_/MRDRNA2_87662_c0_seq1:67-1104(+)
MDAAKWELDRPGSQDDDELSDEEAAAIREQLQLGDDLGAEVDVDITGEALGAEQAAVCARDAAVEDEVLRCGFFADIVFKFRGVGCEAEEVYGQTGLFALLSPMLRELLARPAGKGGPPEHLLGQGIRVREVWLEGVTAIGFRAAARHIYRLPLQLAMSELPHVLECARELQLPELSGLAVEFGLQQLKADAEDKSTDKASSQSKRCEVGLQCLEELRGSEHTSKWQHALLQAQGSAKVLKCATFSRLSFETVLSLLSADAMHEDETKLWLTCVAWTKAITLADSDPQAWQRKILHLVPALRFALMPAADFAEHVQGVIEMTQELRQAIYAARRHSLRGGMADAL